MIHFLRMLERHKLNYVHKDKLHASRLLNVEEKTFRRLTKRLLTPDALPRAFPQAPPTPPPESDKSDNDSQSKETLDSSKQEKLSRWREDALIDFAGFESNLARVQFLLRSNELERQRYAAEKERIVATAQSVRENNGILHEQLQEAQTTLAIRKTYDEFSEKITSNQNLKPRDEQHSIIQKLQSEIAELERESEEYSKTWAERREQFGRIVEEGTQLLRLIRDEKEEAERQGDFEVVEEEDATKRKTEISRTGTPKPNDEAANAATSTDAKDPNSLAPRTSQNSRAPTPVPRDPTEKDRSASLDATAMDAAEADQTASNEDEGEVEEGEEQDNMETT